MSAPPQIHYWDAFPKRVKVSRTWWSMALPLSIRGNPRGDVNFESLDESIARVDWRGRVVLGWRTGHTIIMVYDSEERDSVRYVEVEVVENWDGERY
jgi:hypothetical protein